MATATCTASLLAPQLSLSSLLLLLLVSLLQLNVSLGQYGYPQPNQYEQPNQYQQFNQYQQPINPYSGGVPNVYQPSQPWLTNNVGPYPNPPSWQPTSATYPSSQPSYSWQPYMGMQQQQLPMYQQGAIISGLPIQQHIIGEDTDIDLNTNLNTNIRDPRFLAAVMKSLRGIIDEHGNLVKPPPTQPQLIPAQLPYVQ